MAESHGWGTPNGVQQTPTVTPLPSRRAMRDARLAVDPRSVRRPEHAGRRTTAPVRPATPPASIPVAPRRTRSRVVFSAVVMTLAAGLVATLALPSYAFDPSHGTRSAERSQGIDTTTGGDQQLPQVAADVRSVKVTRDAVTATTAAELKRAALAKAYSAYTGPTAAQLAARAVPSGAGLSGVLGNALQYQGVPYVFGGADPSGFDCSGFIMYVYAKFGVSLPHSVHQQDAIGTPITQAQAQPGDVVIFNDESHDGFYAGNGMILHAPYPGANVREQPLWSSDVHFVRFAVK
ncbi:MAG TPA: NlpC/P60 family protein [Amnibacterium sp.]